MLTLVKTKDAVPIVGIYRGTKNKTPEHTVYFTHDLDPAKQNVAPAAGVLHLHKKSLKKEFHLNDCLPRNLLWFRAQMNRLRGGTWRLLTGNGHSKSE